MKKEIMDIIEESKFKLNSSEYAADKIIEKIEELIDDMIDRTIVNNFSQEEALFEIRKKIQEQK